MPSLSDSLNKSGVYGNSAYEALKKQFDPNRIAVGIVMDNRDPGYNGAVKVWLLGSNLSKNDPDSWITVYYAPPFYGATPNRKGDTFDKSKKVYGAWFPCPDVGVKLFIKFANIPGSNIMGFYDSVVPEIDNSRPLPGIAYKNIDGKYVPTTGFTSDKALTDGMPENTYQKFEPLSEGLEKQGLSDDFLRGPTSSSSRRDSPSRSYGFVTPRGTQVIMDDGWSEDDVKIDDSSIDESKNPANKGFGDIRHDEQIRLRTRSGAEILVSEEFGHIYIINKSGTCWWELNDNGHIDFWAQNSINCMTNGDINYKAKGKINIEADKDLTLRSKSGKVNLNSANNMNIKSSAGLVVESGANTSLNASGMFNLTTSMFNNSATITNTISEIVGTFAINSPTPVPPQNCDELNLNDLPDADGVTESKTVVSRMPHKEPWKLHQENVVKNEGN